MNSYPGKDNFERAKTCVARARRIFEDLLVAEDRAEFLLFWENFLNQFNKARKQTKQFSDRNKSKLGKPLLVDLGNGLNEEVLFKYLHHARNCSEHSVIEVSRVVNKQVVFGGPGEMPALSIRGGSSGFLKGVVLRHHDPEIENSYTAVDSAKISEGDNAVKFISNSKWSYKQEHALRLVDVVDRDIVYSIPKTDNGLDHSWEDVARAALQILERKLDDTLSIARDRPLTRAGA